MTDDGTKKGLESDETIGGVGDAIGAALSWAKGLYNRYIGNLNRKYDQYVKFRDDSVKSKDTTALMGYRREYINDVIVLFNATKKKVNSKNIDPAIKKHFADALEAMELDGGYRNAPAEFEAWLK